MTPTVHGIAFLLVVILVSVAFAWLLLPFYGALLWAVILAIVFNPLHRRFETWTGGRRNLAAALSLLACICIVVIPGSLILPSLAQEATSIYNFISAREFDPATTLERVRSLMPGFLQDALAATSFGSLEKIQENIISVLGSASQAIATKAVSIGQGTAQLFISLGVMLYVLFFLFRDGPAVSAMIRKASPLSSHHTEYILGKFSAVLKATVKGNVIIAAIQGAIGGIAFWALGIQAPLLWGVLMAVLSLVPAVGAFLIWGPVAAYLMLSGDYAKGITLIVIGALVIGMVDNILRPPLVGKGVRLPDYVILVSTLGGIALFGINGFVIGPLIAALFVAVWSLFTDDQMRLKHGNE